MELAIQKTMTTLNWAAVAAVIVLAMVGYFGGGAKQNRLKLAVAMIAAAIGYYASLPIYLWLANNLFDVPCAWCNTCLMGIWFMIFAAMGSSIYELLTVSGFEIFGRRKG